MTHPLSQASLALSHGKKYILSMTMNILVHKVDRAGNDLLKIQIRDDIEGYCVCIGCGGTGQASQWLAGHLMHDGWSVWQTVICQNCHGHRYWKHEESQ